MKKTHKWIISQSLFHWINFFLTEASYNIDEGDDKKWDAREDD